MMLRGVFGSLREPISALARPILRPGRFQVMWAFPSAEIADEVDGGDDGTCCFLDDSTADVVLRGRWCSLRDAAVRAAMAAVLERPRGMRRRGGGARRCGGGTRRRLRG